LPEVLGKLLERVRRLDGIDAKAVKTLGEEWDEHEARLSYYRGRTMVGLKTGLPEFDKRTLGLRGLFIFGAKPGAGKTTFGCVAVAIGVCRHFADNGCVVIVVCLDMDRFELYRRIHCNLGDIEWVPLMFGSPEEEREAGSKFSKAHQKCLKRAKQRLEEYQVGKRLVIPDRTVLGEDVTVQRLSAIVQEHKARAGAKRALLIIDYLQLIPVPEEVTARGDLAADKYRVRLVQQVIERSRTADDPLGDTALVISEARKPPTSKDTWGDSMSELMGSARLGYAGDAVLLYREMNTKEMGVYYGAKDEQAAQKRRDALRAQGVAPVTLILEKGRDGMIRGKWGAEFHFRKSVFRELAPNQHLLASVPPPDDPPGGGQPKASGASPGSPPNGHLALPPPGPGFQGKPKKKAKKKGKGTATSPAKGGGAAKADAGGKKKASTGGPVANEPGKKKAK
jgi:replicative DNA helicase